MITIATVLTRIPGLDETRLHVWIEQRWVRPTRQDGELRFAEIDVARLHLLADLEALELGDNAMPVVLSLLDQLHDTRRQLHRLLTTLDPPTLGRLYTTRDAP